MNSLKFLIHKPLFWISLFFLVRLIGISNPPLETGHNWRQVTGLMVSRNFVEVDANILYPRVDDNHGETGIIGMEFPLMNYLYFLLAQVFGFQHWYGRLIGLLVSSLGSFYFYKLVQQQFNQKKALFAMLALTCSIWFAYSRKMMPDVFSISLMMPALYYGVAYFKTGKKSQLWLYFIFALLAGLSKIPALIYGSLFLPYLINNTQSWKKSLSFVLLSILILFLVYFWYFWWCPQLSEQYGNWYNIGQSFSEGFQEISQNLGAVFKNFYFHSFYSYTAIALFLLGLIFSILKKERKILLAFSLPLLLFVIYILKSGFYFHHHNYYIIPIIPAFALLIAYFLDEIIPPKWASLLLAIACIESMANQQHDFIIKEKQAYKMKLEKLAAEHIPKEALVVINIPDNPQELYLSHRKGWLASQEDINKPEFIENLAKKSCRFIIIDFREWNGEKPEFKPVYLGSDFGIYEI